MTPKIKTALLATTLLVPQAHAARKVTARDSPENTQLARVLMEDAKSAEAHRAVLSFVNNDGAADIGETFTSALDPLGSKTPVQATLEGCRKGRPILVRDENGNPEILTLGRAPDNAGGFAFEGQSLIRPGTPLTEPGRYADQDTACKDAIRHTFEPAGLHLRHLLLHEHDAPAGHGR